MQLSLNQEVIELVNKILIQKWEGKIEGTIPPWVYQARLAARGKAGYVIGITQANRLPSEFPQVAGFREWVKVGRNRETLLVERIPLPPEQNAE